MKKALAIAALAILFTALAIFLVVRLIWRHANEESDAGWGPEPRAVKILSADAIPASVFYQGGSSAPASLENGNAASYFYRAKALDLASGTNLRWKLGCAQEIKPPATMTYTPYGDDAASRLEIRAVVSGPYKDEAEATASLGSSLPADEEVKSFLGVTGDGSQAESVYVLQRAPIVAGNDFRTADPGTDPNSGQRVVRFTLTTQAGNKLYDFTSGNIGQRMAVVMGGRVREVATIESAIRDSGEIMGSFSSDDVAALSGLLHRSAAEKLRAQNDGSLADTSNPNSSNQCSVTADR
ncbi:MAG: hypothetical protein ABR924_10085 [Terracidiphilus sp.]|jgi:hypothetical protein